MEKAATGNSLSQMMQGSFRDPSGYVFQREGRIFRAVDESCYELLTQMVNVGLFGDLVKEGLLVETQFVEDSELHAALVDEHTGYVHFLEHARIPIITYPYEWSISMLAEAGIHTLRLQLRLLEHGYSLKDASAYNIQFITGQPVFIDVSSIVRPVRLDLWYALGQFGQMFTFPLLLRRYYGWDFPAYFLASINGRSIEQVAETLGWLGRLRPQFLMDVTIPFLLNRRANAKGGNERAILAKPVKNPNAQIMNLRRLQGKVRTLADGYQPTGVWAEYTSTCTYNDGATHDKKSMVREFLEAVKPKRVLDIGCNSGEYSYLSANCGAQVLAADSDHDAVELLFRRLKKEPGTINPIILDLSNPSPAIGFRNQERMRFLDRVDVDCVLALALFHHLHVTNNMSLIGIRDLFFDMTKDSLIFEFVPHHDDMFQQLLKFREDLYSGLTLDSLRKVFSERFALLREVSIPGTERTLILFRKLT